MRHLPVTMTLFALAACSTTGDPLPETTLPEQERVNPDGGTAVDAGATSAIDAGTTDAGPGEQPDAGVAEEQWVYPDWSLPDVQPNSPRHAETYGLERFRGRTVVVILLYGWCPYCRSNSKVAQALRDELVAERRDVEFVILADSLAENFVPLVSLPIFKDASAKQDAWWLMRPNPEKHDTFVFAPNGKRTFFRQGSYTGGDPEAWKADLRAAVRATAASVP